MVKEEDGWRLPERLWAQREPLLPPRKPHPLGCHNLRLSDRAAMNALNGTGICSSSSAHRRSQEWGDAGVFEKFWMQGMLNAAALREIDWSRLALNSVMTKAPMDGEKTSPNATCRGKGGINRSLLTDGQGTPLAGVIDSANRHDMKLAKHMKLVKPRRESLKTECPSLLAVWLQGPCLDKGHDYPQIWQLVADFGYRLHIRSRAEEQQHRKAGQHARRWVVERTHSRLHRFRELLFRRAKKEKDYLAFLYLACVIIALRIIGPLV